MVLLQPNLLFALKKIKVPLSEDGVPQSVIREISALKAIERADHPNITKLIDVCHGLVNEQELYIHVIFEKCDWDLYDFLQRIPVDMSDVQIRHMAKQVLFNN
uniref:Protein kinase domain-containing protein n=1 Tax=Plectus sambesii TaxID=2011161 RepID=A0A914W350_9BILA